MCNPYCISRSSTEIARLFSVEVGAFSNTPTEIYPGIPGWVIVDGAVQSMIWGFPLVLKSKRTGEPLRPKPVNNARADKLDTYFWRSSFTERRCLIPVSTFAEAEGAKGAKTKTWFAVPDAEIFACAGIWRQSDEWGRCYSMIMIDANETVAPVQDRMPAVLNPNDYDAWLFGSAESAKALCKPYSSQLVIDATTDPWMRRRCIGVDIE